MVGGPAVGHLEAVAAAAVVLACLLHLLPRVHDEGPVPYHRLAVRPRRHQHDPRALLLPRCTIGPQLHAVAVAVVAGTEHDERARGGGDGGVAVTADEGGLAVDDVGARAPPARDGLPQARAGPQGDVEAQRWGAGPERGPRAQALARDDLDGDAVGGGGRDVVAR